MMALKGSAVFYDLTRVSQAAISRHQADLVAVVVLLWPMCLPSGLVWLLHLLVDPALLLRLAKREGRAGGAVARHWA